MTEEPKKTTTQSVVSRSHSPFFYFSFSIVVTSRPVTRPLKLSLRLSVVTETSQVSVLPAPAVHYGICSVLNTYTLSGQTRYGLQQTNEPTNFCCILSVWTLAGNLRMLPGAEKPQSHLYIVLFLMFVCMSVGCVFNGHHVMWKKKRKKKRNTSSTTTNTVGRKRRPLISSRSMQWIIFGGEKRNMSEEVDVKKSRTIIVYHTWVVVISGLLCLAFIEINKEVLWFCVWII